MENTGSKITGSSTWLREAAPIVTLVFLSPVLVELLPGIMHVTTLWLLLPEMGVYGVGALLIREFARRRQRGWGTILLLGLAFAVAEECIILQTSLTPQFFPPAFTGNFGWVGGVQWIYLTALLWYESAFAIVLPVYLTEILYPERKKDPWLDQRGLAIAAAVFVLASIGAWWLWTHGGLVRYGPSSYVVPPAYVGAAFLLVAALVGSALIFLRKPASPAQRSNRRAWAPGWVGVLSFGHSLAWFILIGLAYIPAKQFPGVSPLVPMAIGAAWVGLGLVIVKALSNARDWGNRQRLALIFGASLGSMLGGVLVVLAAASIDQIGKAVIDLVAVVLFIVLAARVKRRSQGENSPGS